MEQTNGAGNGYLDDQALANPVLARVWRGERVESVHRGAWCLSDPDGRILAGAGAFEEPVFVRSAIKAIQALPLLEEGAAARFDLTDEELALTLSSHNGEACHVSVVERLLERLGLGEGDLRCGAHVPGDRDTRRAFERAGRAPSQLHNNCSGKHAGFLALSLHAGQESADYLDPAGRGQASVRATLAELADLEPDELVPAVDGCSAPTYRVSLARLARAFARLTTPDALPASRAAAARRLTAAAARYPHLVAGNHRRICTDLLRASGGRLFPKVGAEAVYGLGEREAGRALAVKIDDGGLRGLHAVVVGLAEHLGLLRDGEGAGLSGWRAGEIRNWAGLSVGRVEVVRP